MQPANDQIHTELFRYPAQFGYAWYLQRMGLLPADPRILSFGCSTGEELVSLRHYFPTARLFGCDVVDAALVEARRATAADPRTTVFVSTREALGRHGPYDLIMANSVLCTNTDDPRLLGATLPFAGFEDLLCGVAEHLAPDGAICVYNPSYLPDESEAFLRIAQPVRSHFSTLGYVPKFSRSGQLLVGRTLIDGKGYYAIAPGVDPSQLRTVQNSFYARGRALREFRIDYSPYPNAKVARRRIPDDPRLIVERPVSHRTDDYAATKRWAWPRHDNLDAFVTGFLPEVQLHVPGVTDGFVSLA